MSTTIIVIIVITIVLVAVIALRRSGWTMLEAAE